MVSLERAVSQKDAHNYLQEYSIKLGPGDDPNNPASEQRGVLVIKSKSKTKAKQRKGAVANWKVIYLLIFILLFFRAYARRRYVYRIYSTPVHQASEFIYRRSIQLIWVLVSNLVKCTHQILLRCNKFRHNRITMRNIYPKVD